MDQGGAHLTLVLDASAALAWIFERQNPAEIARASRTLLSLEDQLVIVPTLWHFEVLNGLVTGHRRGSITTAAALGFLAKLGSLPIDTDQAPTPEGRMQIFAVARQYGLTAYDATYLDLALRTGAALATFDKRLARAQKMAGVPAF